MRYECTEPGFEGAHVSFRSSGLTRPQVAMFLAMDVDKDAWWQLLYSVTESVRIPAVVGDPLTKAEHLTIDNLERVDFVHYRWFWAVVGVYARDVINLGESARRRLLPTPEATAETLPQK